MAKRFKQSEIDELMKDVPILPSGFKDWMMKTPFRDMNYIFYKRIKKEKVGLCSKCGELITFNTKKKHNDKGSCPNCKAKVTYKAINTAKYYEDEQVVTIMQKMKNGYITRYFKVIRRFKNADDTSNFPNEILETLHQPTFYHYEGSRVYINFNKYGATEYRAFEKEYSYKINGLHWVNERKRSGFNNRELLRIKKTFMYKRNLRTLLKNTKWKYSGLDHYKGDYMNIDDYLEAWERYPVLELLVKIKMNNLVKNMVANFVWSGGIYGGEHIKFHQKRLGLSTELFNMVRKLDLEVSDINRLAYFYEKGKKFNEKEFKQINDFQFDAIDKITDYSSLKKALNYIKKQIRNEELLPEHILRREKQIAITWRDYIIQCEWLKLDLKNDIYLYPRDLYLKHDEYTEKIKAMKAQQVIEDFKKQYEKWRNLLSYRNNKYSIEVAHSIESLKFEGSTLKHCVGGYAPNIASGKSLVLFIRKKNMQHDPYYTLELNPKSFRIVQIQGKERVAPTKAVSKFIKEWELKIVKPIQLEKEKAS